jgi:general secretion pathway protein M
MELPTGNRAKWVAVSLLFIPILLVYQVAIGPMLARYGAVGDEIEQLESDIVRYQRLLAQGPGLAQSIEQFDAEFPIAPYLLDGSNSALAAANLQRRLQEIAAEHGARVISVQVQTPVEDGPLEKISLQARLQADSLAFRDTLYDLETGQPYLFIENLGINVRPTARRREEDQMEIRMSLVGYRIPDQTGLAGDDL